MHTDMSTYKKLRPSCKVWIEYDGQRVLGKGGAAILEQIDKLQSISKAAEKLGMSYRYVWNYLNEVRRVMDEPVVETFKGGRAGGGGARLGALGKYLLSEYIRVSSNLEKCVSENRSWEVNVVKISARNHLKGRVTAVKKDGVMALVKIKVTEPAEMTALISNESAEELGIKVGDNVEAVVKATQVMIAK